MGLRLSELDLFCAFVLYGGGPMRAIFCLLWLAGIRVPQEQSTSADDLAPKQVDSGTEHCRAQR